MEKGDIYKVTEKFSEGQWREFTRLKLGLDENKITDLENRWGDDYHERKFKTVMAWLNPNESSGNLMKRLITLKHEYYCGEHEEATSGTQREQSADDLAYVRYTERYKLTAKKGIILIIGNSFTVHQKKELHRTSTCQRDVESMEKLWRDTIGCTLLGGMSYTDKSAAEMRDLLRKLGNSQGYDYVVVVISTHGGMIPQEIEKNQDETSVNENPRSSEEVLLGNDGTAIKAKEIESFYDNYATHNLQDIPKLFILQYCRGGKKDHGVYKQSDVTSDALPILDQIPIDSLIPTKSDVVTAYPTQVNERAYKDEKGSWFIQSISRVFTRLYRYEHVTDMLTDVNLEMMNMRGEINMKDCKAMSIYKSSLTKRFYLVDPLLSVGLIRAE
uniref:caspase-2-like n=1 Tax=Styela clava TaxID=7725 RepID=UPI00193A0266|nr:caspase-2-like [Styela clava]